MPRNVRNFWVEANVDGRAGSVAFGPQNKEGGFDLTIKQRNEGGIITALEIRGRVGPNGQLMLYVDRPAESTGQLQWPRVELLKLETHR